MAHVTQSMTQLMQQVSQKQKLTSELHHEVPIKLTPALMTFAIPPPATLPQRRKLKTRSNLKQRSTNKTRHQMTQDL